MPNSYYEIVSESITPIMGSNSINRYGFRIRFENGYMVSIMYGDMMYCSCKNNKNFIDPTSNLPHCPDAEVAIISPDGNFVKFESSDDDVKGNVAPDQLAKILSWVSNLSKEQTV